MRPRLSFCMVTTFYPPYHFGGDGVQVHRLSNELARQGHRVTVVHTPDAYRLFESRPSAARPTEPGVNVVPIVSRSPRLASLATYASGRPVFSRAALEQVFRERFDVVHFH